ncbi:MAG: glycosyltransferase family 39 protein, partial [Planctomycetota bacterium]
MECPDEFSDSAQAADTARDEPTTRATHNVGKLYLIVVVAAILIRLAVFWEAWHDLPYLRITVEGHDQHTYNVWAQKILDGDPLSRHQGVFYYTPLYPYMLAAAYVVGGAGNVLAGVVMNGILGVCAAVCAAGIARRLFGWLAGLAAGILMALNGSQLSVEVAPLVDSVLTPLCLGALWLIVEFRERAERDQPVPLWAWALPGVLLGLAAVGRGSNLLVAAAMCAMLAGPFLKRREWRTVARAAVMGIAVCVVAGTVAARNGLMFDDWVITSNGPVLLYIGNVPGTSGAFHYPPKYHAIQQRAQTRSVWLEELARELKQQPMELPRALLRKSLLFFNSWDIPDNGNYYFLRRYLFTVRAFTFGPLLLYVVGFLGVILTARHWRQLVPLYVFGLSFALSLIIVFVSGRYKLPFLGLLAVFGGAALVAALRHMHARRLRAAAACALMAVLLTVAFWPRGVGTPARKDVTLRAKEFVTHAAVLMAHQRADEAVAMLEDGADLFPKDARFLERLAAIALNEARPADALDYTDRALASGLVTQRVLERRTIAYAHLGRSKEAMEALQQLAERYPNSELARRALARSRP